MKNFFVMVLRFLKYWLWDRWFSGRSVTDTQTRRIIDPNAPAFYIGRIPVPWWVLIALGVALFIALLLSISNIHWVSNSTLDRAVGAESLRQISSCSAVDKTGRLYVALDCFLTSPSTQFVGAALLALLQYILVYYLGYRHGRASVEKET